LAGISDRLKPNGQFLSHELLADGPNIEAIHRDLTTSIRVNATPLSAKDWRELCEQAGLSIKQSQTGEMALLKPQRLLQEEGVGTLLTMGWNLLTRPTIRQRIFGMREVFQRYGKDIGYIVLSAQKQSLEG
ncbi:MAG: SAM-dependent methyltransferase, partial [Kamptonema sp. SIO4C4]|nr:SAM-dependent methyltransferase [Kamptonema sp. SIO4C4]